MQTIVTTGDPFTDIDALACAVAHKQLLTLEGNNVIAVLPGSLNKSITKKVRSWKPDFLVRFHGNPSKFIIVDASESEFFAKFVKLDKVVEVYDHRYGFEDYWQNRIGNMAKIEPVGSCATLIWEEFKKRNKSHLIESVNANLLFTAIISNTLNLKSSVTTPRDRNALKEIYKHTKLPKNWIKDYFLDQDKDVNKDPKKTIIGDTKGGEIVIGQLELWSKSEKFIDKHKKEIEESLLSFGNPKWFFTSPCISEGKNYLFTKSEEIKDLLHKILSVRFRGDIGVTDKLWLRKEILEKIRKMKNV